MKSKLRKRNSEEATSKRAAGTTARRITLLRDRMNLSRAALAARSQVLTPPEITHLESGRNKASTLRIRRALAVGFSIPVDVLNGYLEGAIPLAEVVATTTDKPVSAETLETVIKAFKSHRRWAPATIEAARCFHATGPLDERAWLDILDTVERGLRDAVQGRAVSLVRRMPETESHRAEAERLAVGRTR